MRRSAIGSSVLLAATLGLFLAFLFGSAPGFVSIQVWLGATFSWLVLLAVLAIVRRFPVESGLRRPLMRLDRRADASAAGLRPASLIALDRQFALAVGDGRSFDRHLRPRLVRLLAMHGITSDDLGQVAWILDPSTRDRVPTMAELSAIAETFPPAPSTAEEHHQ